MSLSRVESYLLLAFFMARHATDSYKAEFSNNGAICL